MKMRNLALNGICSLPLTGATRFHLCTILAVASNSFFLCDLIKDCCISRNHRFSACAYSSVPSFFDNSTISLTGTPSSSSIHPLAVQSLKSTSSNGSQLPSLLILPLCRAEMLQGRCLFPSWRHPHGERSENRSRIGDDKLHTWLRGV